MLTFVILGDDQCWSEHFRLSVLILLDTPDAQLSDIPEAMEQQWLDKIKVKVSPVYRTRLVATLDHTR